MSKNTKEKSGYYCFPTPLYEMNVIVAFGKENIKLIGDKFKFKTEKGRENLLNSNGYLGFTNFAIDENGNKVVLIVFPTERSARQMFCATRHFTQWIIFHRSMDLTLIHTEAMSILLIL